MKKNNFLNNKCNKIQKYAIKTFINYMKIKIYKNNQNN